AAAPASLPSASGRLVYQIKSPMMTGTQVLYWTDHGKQFRQDFKTSATAGRKDMPMDMWSICDGQYLYSHFSGKTVMRAPIPRGAPRRSSGAQPGPTTVEATQLDLSAKPAASLFKVPPGYQVTDVPQRGMSRPPAGQGRGGRR